MLRRKRDEMETVLLCSLRGADGKVQLLGSFIRSIHTHKEEISQCPQFGFPYHACLSSIFLPRSLHSSLNCSSTLRVKSEGISFGEKVREWMDARFFLLRSKVSPSVRFNTSVPFHSGSVNPENPMENRYRFLPFLLSPLFTNSARERPTHCPKGRRCTEASP